MKKAGTILMYNCSAPEFSKLRQIFAMLHLLMRGVGPEKYHLTLEELALGKGEAAAEAGEPFGEPMLIFYGVNNALLQQVLEIMRLSKMPPTLKAVVTTENKDWDSRKLYEELVREREELAAQKAEAEKDQ